MYRTTSVLALGLFLSLTPMAASAQTQTEQPAQPETQMQTEQPAQPETQQQTTEPAQPETQQQAVEPAQPETQQAEEPAATETQQAEEPAATDAQQTEQAAEAGEQPVEGQILLQEGDAMLASSMIGATVYSPNDESIGKISDLLIKQDGTVQGVVIGVGGFLGIGEKSVALEMNTLTVTPEEGGDVKLVLNSTKEELENAPEFKTAAQMESERQAEEAQQQQATPPAPTAPTAPTAPAQ